MRIAVVGENEAAKAVRGYLGPTFSLVEASANPVPDYTLMVDVSEKVKNVVMDSVDCPLERHIAKHLRELVSVRVEFQTAGGVQSDTAARIVLPSNVEVQAAAALGIHRGFLDLMNKGDGSVTAKPKTLGGDNTALLGSFQAMLSETMNQVALIMVGAADRAAQAQVRQEIEALGSQLRAELQIAAREAQTEAAKRVEAMNAVDAQFKQEMLQEFDDLRAGLIHELREEFAPKAVPNPSWWQILKAVFGGRVQVYDRNFPAGGGR